MFNVAIWRLTAKKRNPSQGGRGFSVSATAINLALATADRLFVDAHGAFAAAFTASGQAAAHGRSHRQAGLVRRRAADAHAVGQHFALAIAAGKATFAAQVAIASTANAATSSIQLAADVLKRLADRLVIARAIDFASIAALFNSDLARCALRRVEHRVGAGSGFFLGGRVGALLFQHCMRHFRLLHKSSRTYGMSNQCACYIDCVLPYFGSEMRT